MQHTIPTRDTTKTLLVIELWKRVPQSKRKKLSKPYSLIKKDLCSVLPENNYSDKTNKTNTFTYSDAEPVFILVSRMTVVHVHQFALDDQTFLKKGKENQSRARGEKWSYQLEQAVLEGRAWGEGPPTDSLWVKDSHKVCEWAGYKENSLSVWDPSAQTRLEQSVYCDTKTFFTALKKKKKEKKTCMVFPQQRKEKTKIPIYRGVSVLGLDVNLDFVIARIKKKH